MQRIDYTNKKVAILGYGVNNAELGPFLVNRGANVTICDRNPNLPQNVKGAGYQLGDNYLKNLDSFDYLFRTPALPYLSPELQAAQKAGAVVTSQTQLFLEECPANTIGVTGTKGKGTTSTLIFQSLEAASQKGTIKGKAYLAGNIGTSPIQYLDTLTADDWIVLELSSFQLHGLTVSPHIAVTLTIGGDHLDHHADTDEYTGAKQFITKNQTANDFLVVHHDNPISRSFADHTKAQVYEYSRLAPVNRGAYVDNNTLYVNTAQPDKVCDIKDIKLIGSFNLENVAAAAAAASIAGADKESIKQAVTTFTGLPHRMEHVGTKNGVSYYNNSYATTPEGAAVSIASFTEPITVILGGSSKGADFTPLVEAIAASSVIHAICIGQEGTHIFELLKENYKDTPKEARKRITLHKGGTSMDQIVALAAEVSEPGDIVLLAPACASFDMFKDAVDRGNKFTKAVQELPDTTSPKTPPSSGKRVHFIGIKGVGMSALAIVAQGLGYNVTGSDVDEEFITDSSLLESGITPLKGFSANHVTSAIDLVVLGAAFGTDNPEYAAAKSLNLRMISYAAFLGQLSRQKKTIAVAGTHGKTTTSSLLSYLLYKANTNPSWVIGTGHVAGLPSHGGAGNGDYFVTEADDYKIAPNDPTPKFLELSPTIGIITSIEHDHPDLYPSLADCIDAFGKFIDRIHTDGVIIVNGDDKNILKLIREFPRKSFLTYGITKTNDVVIHETADGFSLSVYDAEPDAFTFALPGIHNAYNAAAAITAARHCGLTTEQIQEILPTFKNVERRFDVLGETPNDIIVIDDYAHHPTAITHTLEAAKKKYPDRTLFCFFQSHTYSRTKTLFHEFAQSFTAADEVIITDIFGSAREKEVTVTAEELVEETKKHFPKAQYVPFHDLLNFMKQHVPPHAVIITMGAGDIYKVGKDFLNA